MGNYICCKGFISIIYNKFSRGEHCLQLSDLNVKYKHNYTSAERLASKKVIELVKSTKEGLGTAVYLSLMRAIIEAFIDKNTTPLQRTHKIWFVTFFCRGWIQYLKKHKNSSLQNNFISRNAYMCIELNAHCLLMMIVYFQKLSSSAFLPFLLGSQQVRIFFRAVRNTSNTFSTVVNFSVLELLHKIKRLDVQLKVKAACQKELQFPVLKKQKLPQNI